MTKNLPLSSISSAPDTQSSKFTKGGGPELLIWDGVCVAWYTSSAEESSKSNSSAEKSESAKF